MKTLLEKKSKVKVKSFLIECHNTGGIHSTRDSRSYSEGTIEELVKYHSYTLECGASWQHEPGNKKIDRWPKTISSLIKNLNNAVNNSAANGYAGKDYSIVTERKENI